ncbi:MAG: hypothetical protein KDA78_20190, partial [Planctomycetaceae bacterium]|nr:hypothetical protein [Planctomycetaceae bacterium]
SPCDYRNKTELSDVNKDRSPEWQQQELIYPLYTLNCMMSIHFSAFVPFQSVVCQINPISRRYCDVDSDVIQTSHPATASKTEPHQS